MKTRSILIVEDDAEMCEELADILRFEGFEAVTAHNGLDGKTLFDSGDFALVILDLKLPGLDGSELMRHIKKSGSLPVLLITGSPVESELAALLEDNDSSGRETIELADGFIEKPFRIERLIDSLKLLISGREPVD
jgi:two-component system response regulator CpxR